MTHCAPLTPKYWRRNKNWPAIHLIVKDPSFKKWIQKLCTWCATIWNFEPKCCARFMGKNSIPLWMVIYFRFKQPNSKILEVLPIINEFRDYNITAAGLVWKFQVKVSSFWNFSPCGQFKISRIWLIAVWVTKLSKKNNSLAHRFFQIKMSETYSISTNWVKLDKFSIKIVM